MELVTGTRKRIAAPEIKARTPSAAHHAERHTLSPSDHILAGLPVRPKRRDQESRRGQSAGSAEGQGHLDALLGARGLPSARHRDGAAGGARPPAPCLLRGTRDRPAPSGRGRRGPRGARQAYLRYMPTAYAHRKE